MNRTSSVNHRSSEREHNTARQSRKPMISHTQARCAGKRAINVQRSLLIGVIINLLVLPSVRANSAERPSDVWDWAPRAQSSSQLDAFMREPPTIAKPGVCWFWFMGDITKEGMTEQLESMHKAGIGHAEIRCIDDNISVDPKPRQRPEMKYLSDAWLDVFDHACAEAGRLGITLGVNPGLAWMYGGPWVTPEHQGRCLAWEVTEIEGPKTLSETFDKLPNLTKQMTMEGLQKSARLSMWQLIDQKKIVDPKTYLDLGSQVHLKDGKLQSGFTIPTGRYLVALFYENRVGGDRWSVAHVGKDSGGAGPCANYSSHTAMLHQIENTLGKMYARSGKWFGKSLRYLVTDSWEYDGPMTWSQDAFALHEQLEGNSLSPNLYQWCGYGPPQTLHPQRFQMLLAQQGFFKTITDWAHTHGLVHRAQGQYYGGWKLGVKGPHKWFFDAVVDEPDTETVKLCGLEQSRSVSHCMGKPIVGCEAFTWLGNASLGLLRDDSNVLFAWGVNGLRYHSMPYSPRSVPPPGWRMYAKMDFTHDQPWWPYVRALTGWQAHVQAALQAGAPHADLLVLLRESEQWQNMRTFTLDTMPNVGVVESAPLDFASQIAETVQAGRFATALLSISGSPDSLNDRERAAIERLCALGSRLVCEAPSAPAWRRLLGEGKTIASRWQDVAKDVRVLSLDPLPHGSSKSEGNRIAYQQRQLVDGALFYLANVGDTPYSGTLRLRLPSHRIEEWDCETLVHRRLVPLAVDPAGHPTFPLQLDRKQGLLLVAVRDGSGPGQTLAGSIPCRYRENDGVKAETDMPGMYTYALGGSEERTWRVELPQPIPVVGPWSVAKRLDIGRAALVYKATPPARIERLKPWKDIPDFADYAGTAEYRSAFSMPKELKGTTFSWRLDLGEVRHLAQVWINDREIGLAWHHPFVLVIPADVLRHDGENTLVVQVANLIENYPKHPTPKVGEKPDSGLLGPIVLRPVATAVFAGMSNQSAIR